MLDPFDGAKGQPQVPRPELGSKAKAGFHSGESGVDLLIFNDYLDLESEPRKKGRGFDPALSVRD